MKIIKWASKKEETELIQKIVQRALKYWERLGLDMNRSNLEMDISACHANGCPLELQKLLDADDFNFIHDIAGIMQHINRKTGKLKKLFLPRFAKPKNKKG